MRVNVKSPITRPVLETGFFWLHATGGVRWGSLHGLAHRLKSKLSKQWDTLSAKNGWVDQLLARANFPRKARCSSWFTFLNRPCYETTCRGFIFSLGLAERFGWSSQSRHGQLP